MDISSFAFDSAGTGIAIVIERSRDGILYYHQSSGGYHILSSFLFRVDAAKLYREGGTGD